MTAAPIEDTTVIDLADHEFDLPCKVTTTTLSGTKSCEATAVWFVEHERHCPPGQLITRLFCVVHFAYLASGGAFHCGTCKINHQLKVTRTERLKP